ncbi:tripartite motif-containing protein 16-like isoform X1 [Erpetoichthys calabaricus]|uniref:tripartite motif-containing protein 16-like isoform X1 n=1 Tax=Erpetoichthys calabaricus TaxID=27687 RepID=UPI002234298E|nr:tripartite motif-containing protein 16-like isoform X1 [Erpetoichthys calabaricus]
MAEAPLLVSQEEFICSVCLEILTDPVSLHCGHSFCLNCLTNCWDRSEVSRCPHCRHTFILRPELHINTVLNEIVKRFKNMGVKPPPPPPSPRPAPPSQNYAGPGDVECDFCTGTKLRAVKSCLTCMASFCQTHMQPHYEVAAWKAHKLVDPDGNLQEKLCGKHRNPLELFCKTDETCICVLCVATGHRNHETVELETEREEKEKQLGVTRNEIRRRLQEKEKTLEETRRAMKKVQISLGRQVDENDKSFADLIRCIEEAHKKLKEKIREQEKREIEKAEGVMEQLEKEIKELKRRDAELKGLSETKDHIHFLQTFSSLCVLPDDGHSLRFTATADFSSEYLQKELCCLKKSLEKISQWDIMTRTPSGSDCEAPTFTLQPPELKGREAFLQYFCPLTLDMNTAHKLLHLSEKNKKVTCMRTEAGYPDHPDRFDYWTQVLCREALTGTCCYWEVEWNGYLMGIGVTYKGLGRKGRGKKCSLGNNDMSWSLWWSEHRYMVYHNDKETAISAPYSPRIGVYLDWPAGSLSFYSVSHTMTLLHRFNTSFTEPLYPGFGFSVFFHSSVTISQLTPRDH